MIEQGKKEEKKGKKKTCSTIAELRLYRDSTVLSWARACGE